MRSRCLLYLSLLLVLALAGCDALVPSDGTVAPGTPGVVPAEQGCVWGASVAFSAATPGAGSASPQTLGAIHPMDEPIKVGDLSVLVDKVFCPPGVGSNQAAAGKQFVVVQYTVQNNGSSNQTISGKFQSTLRDAAGTIYKPDDVASQFAGDDLTGIIPQGQSLTGRVGFQVPIRDSGLVFIFDSHPFGDQGRALVAIQ